MGTSDLIARFILDAIDEANGIAELKRVTLAEQFSCVPSQINYVISTRFSPEHGYIVESRRGGGGYIRITRVHSTPKQLIMHIVNSIGSSIDLPTANAFLSNAMEADAIDKKSIKLIQTAIGNAALRPVPAELRDTVRASILKYMLVGYISD
ncbi:MAG: CtsR family transcriptional regulator [Oscillospiraceae bacterium]|jgi:transcriptional regulator CtsR